MITEPHATYRMHPKEPAVLIGGVAGREEYAINRDSLVMAIANVTASRADYVTQEAYDRSLALNVEALAFLDAHLPESRRKGND